MVFGLTTEKKQSLQPRKLRWPVGKRRRRESNPRIEVLQTSALPLGYPAALTLPNPPPADLIRDGFFSSEPEIATVHGAAQVHLFVRSLKRRGQRRDGERPANGKGMANTRTLRLIMFIALTILNAGSTATPLDQAVAPFARL